MAWLRTREIRPGVYETQSAGHHVASQTGKAVAVLLGVPLALMAVAGIGIGLFNGNWESAGGATMVAVLLIGVPYWHYRYNKAHPGERSRRNGPWDA